MSAVIFFVTESLPGDVATIVLGQGATPSDVANLRTELGLDRPVIVRYADWITSAAQGDLGDSYVTRTRVASLLIRRLGNSLILAAAGFMVSVPVGIVMGILAGTRRDGVLDRLSTTFGLVAMSTPEFAMAIVLILLFSSRLGWLPASSTILPNTSPLSNPAILIMPALTVSAVLFGYVLRMTRTNVIDVMESAFIRTATLKGLPLAKVVGRHALPSAIIPTITVIMTNVGWLIGGLVVVENVFAYQGMGSLLLSAISRRDVPTLQATVLVVATAYGLSALIADLLYTALDPRIRLWAKHE